MKLSFNIFEYKSSRQVLLDYLSARQKIEPEFSIRAWSRELQFHSRSLLQFWLLGKRKIRPQHTPSLCRSMKLGPAESEFFENIVLIENANTVSERDQLIKKLARSTSGLYDQDIEWIEEFKFVSHWIHMAILASRVFTKSGLFKKFGHLVTRAEIDSALYRLQKLGFIEIEASGLYRTCISSLTSRNDFSDCGAREYHMQTSDLAKSSLDSQSVAEREFQSFAMNINQKDIPEIKQRIREFRADLNRKFGHGEEQIYQCNFQFFRLSRQPKYNSRNECRDGSN